MGVPASFLCRVLLLVGICFSPLAPVFAAATNDEWLARSWQTEDGLPDNSVAGVVQTSDGYLWVGTPSGLARFDGLRFENISLTNIIALPNRGMVAMIHGRRGALWLAMDRGAVVRLSGSTSRAFVNGLPDFIPNGMTEDSDGALWIAYRGGSVYRVKDDQVTPVTAQQGLPAGADICALATDNSGRVWFAKAGMVGVISNAVLHVVQKMDLAAMRLAPAQDGGVWLCCGFKLFKGDTTGNFASYGEFYQASSGAVVTDLLEDDDGAVWIGTLFNGLFHHDQSGFQSIATSHTGISSLTKDGEGNIWAGTSGGGLNCIHRRAITLEGADTGLPFPSILSVCEAADGSIWAATQNGVLVHKVGDKWYPIPVDNDWPGAATCVNADTNGTVWIGTRQHGLYCWRDGRFVDWGDAAAVRGQTFHTLLVSRSGDLWLGQESPNAVLRLHDGRITNFSISTSNRIIRAMVEDVNGNIFVGTSRGSLFRINGDQMVEVATRPPEEPASIRCLYPTPDGTLWIGYAGWGVGRLKDGHYAEFNTGSGLFDDYVSHIVADDGGWLWFGANRGIFKVREQDFEGVASGRLSRVRSVHYGKNDGLPSLQGTFGDSPDVVRSRDGRLWIPMQTALVVVDPSKIYENIAPPPTLLTRVAVDDRTVAEYTGILPRKDGSTSEIFSLPIRNATLHLEPGHHSVKFEYAAFDFRAPENIQYRHRLQGVEDDWVDTGPLHTVSYPRLDNGKYTFELTACNGDGDWNQNTSRITLAVGQFYWNTWWFQVLSVAAFTLCIVAIVRYVSFRRLHNRLRLLEQQAALQRERARIAKDIHDDLGANLTQIAFMGELANQDRDEPDLVGERIRKISATARQAVKSLDEIVWAVNPRNDTLSHLLDYAGQFAVDYLRLIGIRCRLDFPESVPARELSTDLRHNLFLVVKESLHNIFKHANATEVNLRAMVDETALVMYIEDNGCGFTNAPTDALSDGLRNMKQRMTDIGGSLDIESQSGRGTRITLCLPWPAVK